LGSMASRCRQEMIAQLWAKNVQCANWTTEKVWRSQSGACATCSPARGQRKPKIKFTHKPTAKC
jgi:hypothetical protein